MEAYAAALAPAAAQQRVSATRAPVEAVEDARITIDFPPRPDDVRLRAQTTRRFKGASCVPGLVGLASMVISVAGLATGVYFAINAAAEVEDSPAADNRRSFGYSIGGGVALLSAALITFGIRQIYLCKEKRREASQVLIPQNTHVRFSMTPREDGAHDDV